MARHALRPAEQAVGPRDQHDGHDDELGDQRELGEVERDAGDRLRAKADADGLDLGDQQRRHVGARNRAHAADHHDDERVAERAQVHAQVRRLAGRLERAAEAGERRAERKDRGKELRLVDAERRHHVAVLGRCAHQRPPARAREQQMQADEHDGPDDEQEEVVLGELAAEDLHRAAQARGARPEQVFHAPERRHDVAQQQHQRERRQQLEQLGGVIDAAQERDLYQCSQQRERRRRGEHAAPEAEHPAQARGAGIGDVGAQHVQRAVRHVDDARDAENQRQPRRQEKQRRGVRQAVQGLERQDF